MRCSRSDRAIGSQCLSAPSEAVNGMSRFTPRSLSNSCFGWPGQNCSPSGSVISNGVVIWSTTSVRLYWRGRGEHIKRGLQTVRLRAPLPVLPLGRRRFLHPFFEESIEVLLVSRVEQLPQLRRRGFRPRLENVVHAGIRDRRGDAVLERQRAGYPVAGLANAVQHDLLRIYVGAIEQEVHDRRDDMLPVVPERHPALEQHRLLARAVEDQDVVPRATAPAATGAQMLVTGPSLPLFMIRVRRGTSEVDGRNR
jgi:hypothetical protein